MITILDLTAKEAKDFLFRQDIYCTIDLPKYFNFQNILDKLRNVEITDKGKWKNYTIYQNKDGNLSWRKLQLINPLAYTKLVNVITEEKNWEFIQKRFTKFRKYSKVKCESMSLLATEKIIKEISIWNWWQSYEQNSIKLSLEYNWMVITDISNCYDSLYTHTISWALHGKCCAKSNIYNDSLLGNKIDKIIRNMSDGQTNGIPQGSALMDFIAEIVLGYADVCLQIEAKKENIREYKIIRYRDDYRIFTKTKEDAARLLKILSDVLLSLSFRLNTQKTLVTDDLIHNSIKEDKLIWNKSKQEESTLQKHLLLIHSFSQEYPNTGSLKKAIEMFIDRLNAERVAKADIEVLTAIIVDITLKNPNIYSSSAILIGILLSYANQRDAERMYQLICEKFDNFPNVEIMKLWLQRINCHKKFSEKFNTPLCGMVRGKKYDIWGMGSQYKSIFKDHQNSIIDNEILRNISEIPDKNESKIFKNSY